MVRPEKVDVRAEASRDGGAMLAATIVDLVFQGPVLRCVLRDEAGRTLYANLGPEARSAGLERGRSVYATWRADDARLLRPHGAPPDAIDGLRT